jgi:hypothetical protein
MFSLQYGLNSLYHCSWHELYTENLKHIFEYILLQLHSLNGYLWKYHISIKKE